MRISFDDRLASESTIRDFCRERMIHLWIGQKSYFQTHMRLLTKPLEAIVPDGGPLWIFQGQSFRISFTGPEFMPDDDANIVFGLYGTIYRGVC